MMSYDFYKVMYISDTELKLWWVTWLSIMYKNNENI